jgi:hypothetical protein
MPSTHVVVASDSNPVFKVKKDNVERTISYSYVLQPSLFHLSQAMYTSSRPAKTKPLSTTSALTKGSMSGSCWTTSILLSHTRLRPPPPRHVQHEETNGREMAAMELILRTVPQPLAVHPNLMAASTSYQSHQPPLNQ